MADQLPTTIRCQTCGSEYPAGTAVCQKCYTILAQPQRFVYRTPKWVIMLLVLLIVALAGYAGYLAWDQLVLHNYNNSGWHW